jgi:GNAT superfamily N-acetyltransferase
VTIIERTRESGDFYHLVGPFLGSRDVHRALGGPVYDDPGKRWWIAIHQQNVSMPHGPLRGMEDGYEQASIEVVGFCALTVDGPTVHLGSAYVVPEHRSDGVYAELFEARLKAARASGLKLRATVKPDAATLFRRHGFRVVRETANYTVFELAPPATPAKKNRRKK